MRSRLVCGLASVTGGRLVFTPAGGSGTCWQRNCSRTNRPRAVGEESSGFAVSARNRPWPSSPARSESGRERHAIELLRGRRHFVDGGQFGTHDSRRSAVNSVHEVAIVPDQVADKGARFFGHRDGGLAREQRELAAVFAGGQQAIEAQPLADEFVEGFVGARLIEHAPRGLFDALRRGEIAARRRREQLRIGHGVPDAYRRAGSRSRTASTSDRTVSSRRNRKFGDCSIASTTSCAPFRKSVSRRHQAFRSASVRPASSGRRKAFSPNSRTNRARQAAEGLHGISPCVSPPRKASRASFSAAAL